MSGSVVSKIVRKCLQCAKEFSTNDGRKKYCSPGCVKYRNGRAYWVSRKLDYKVRLKYLFFGARNRAQTKNLAFEISPDYLIELWETQEGKCLVSGIEFDLSLTESKGQPRFNAPSIDRINPSKGYIKGNVRLVCYQVNIGIHDYGLDSFLNLCKTVIRFQEYGVS